ncbi:MAG: DUF86 domain-containing protein [Desulfuromusa sp.]|nr:DUF86 domain-containing protein [Desulfuromusa sp.]
MYDWSLIIDILKQISWSLDQISKRFAPVESIDDFIGNDRGLEKLDSICMQVIALGEALKQVDKLTNSTLLRKYPSIDWKKAKGLRDIITHHYFDIDAEIVYAVCKNRLPEMRIIIDQIIKDLEVTDQRV